jgi:hypothetical protein
MNICENNDIFRKKKEYIEKKIDEAKYEDDKELNDKLEIITNILDHKYLDNSYSAIWNRTSLSVAGMKKTAYSGMSLSGYAFLSAIIIATLIIILFIPIINDYFENNIKNLWFRLFILWLLILVIVFIIEMCVARWYS